MFVNLTTYLYLMLSLTTIGKNLSAITVVDHGVNTIEKESIGIQFYVDIENNHRYSSCAVHSYPRMCCLDNSPYKDCNTDTVYGDNIESVLPKRRETLIYVFPTLHPLDQVGFCDFVIAYKCGRQKRYTKFDINFPFNTNMKYIKKTQYLKNYRNEKLSACRSMDDDCLKKCSPVDCDLKYSGRRPFFDTNRNKCIIAPVCETNLRKELPDMAYDPISNTCRDFDKCLTLGDVYCISTGLGVVTSANKKINKKYATSPALVVTNCTTISENLALLFDLMTGKLCPLFHNDVVQYKKCCTRAFLYICTYVATVSGLLLLIILGIHLLNWCYGKWRRGQMKDAFGRLRPNFTRNRFQAEAKPSKLNRECTNNLLKEVLVRDIPLELRESVEKICDRINKEVKRKKRYRMLDLGSQINLLEDDSRSLSTNSVGPNE